MDAQFERHQPLITARLIFAPKVLPPPPIIAARMEFPSFSIPQYRSPTPETLGKHSSTPKRHAPKHASTPKRHSTPQRDAIEVDSDTTSQRTSTPKRHATPRRPEGTSVAFEIDEDLGSPLSSLSDDEGPESEKDGEGNSKIPKPPGEAGRPQSGGYNLQDKLGWNDRTYESVVALVHKMAKTKLNTAQSFRGQDQRAIKQICDVVRKEYGILKDYQQDWPTRDMLKLHLKYTSEASRRSLTASTARKIEKIATRAMSKTR